MTTATMLEHQLPGQVTVFGPDFPFAFDDWLHHPAGLGSLPREAHGATVAIVGAGLAGLVAAYELMDLGLRPVVYEPTRIGGRLRSHQFEGADGVVAELGGMRFPVSGTSFFHYADRVGLASQRPILQPGRQGGSGISVGGGVIEETPPYAEDTAS